MKHVVNRRRFLRSTASLAAGIGLSGLGNPSHLAASLASGAPNAEKLGWRLACQMYTFNRFTFYESLEKVASLGLKYIEGYAGQALSKEEPETRTNSSMSGETRKEIQNIIALHGWMAGGVNDSMETGIVLRGVDLSGVDLSGLYLRNAILSRADLSEAKLSSSYLYAAYLSRTNMRGADLSWADLREADLEGVEFE